MTLVQLFVHSRKPYNFRGNGTAASLKCNYCVEIKALIIASTTLLTNRFVLHLDLLKLPIFYTLKKLKRFFSKEKKNSSIKNFNFKMDILQLGYFILFM